MKTVQATDSTHGKQIIPPFSNAEASIKTPAHPNSQKQLDESDKAVLVKMILSWEQSARSQFQCGERTADPMGKRLVEHGAVCYFNCAQELRRFLFGS